MKIEKTGNEEFSMDFSNLPGGDYIYQIDENIELIDAKESEAKFIKIPLIVDKVIEGSGEEGDKNSFFFTVVKRDGSPNPFGEKQVVAVLEYTDLIDKFVAKLGEEIDATDPKFVQGLQLELPGKFIRATHELKEDDSGKERINWKKLAAVGGKIGNPDKKQESSGEGSKDESGW